MRMKPMVRSRTPRTCSGCATNILIVSTRNTAAKYRRAVAVLNTGEHHMVKRFVKAQGGCAIPIAIDYKKAMAGLGKIQLRSLDESAENGGMPTQLRVRHPNFTGMQMDYKIYAIRRLWAQVHYMGL